MVRDSYRCLRLADVRRLEALRATDDVELEPLAFGQRLEAIALDRGVVDEYVLATLLLDESKSLRLVEPLHRSTCHVAAPSKTGYDPQPAALGRHLPGHRGRAFQAMVARIQRKPQAISPAANRHSRVHH